MSAFAIHGGRLSEARRRFLQAAEPWIDLSTGINPQARAEGVGVGWVSILDPAHVREILDAPATWTLIGYLCLGFPESESDRPELEAEGWERRRPPQTFLLRR